MRLFNEPKLRRNLLGVCLVAPALLILLIFLAYPFFYGIWLSFTTKTIGQEGYFIMLGNYVRLLKDSIFRLAVFNTILYTAIAVLFKLILGMVLALLLNQNIKFKAITRAIMLLPWIVPIALSGLTYWWLFDVSFSPINWVLIHFGFRKYGINFLGQPNLARMVIIIANIWRGIPYFAISLLAGLQTIPKSLHEAANIDGANSWQSFWRITFPLLRPLAIVVTLFSTIWTLGDFALVYTITRGGPANATQLFGTYSYQVAITSGRLGYGAAIPLYLFPPLAIGAILLFRYRSKVAIE